MSAPNEGRQSPPPEQQTGAQQQDTPAEGSGKVCRSTAALQQPTPVIDVARANEQA